MQESPEGVFLSLSLCVSLSLSVCVSLSLCVCLSVCALLQFFFFGGGCSWETFGVCVCVCVWEWWADFGVVTCA